MTLPTDILAAIRTFAATLPERAVEIAQLRRLPNDIVQTLKDLGVFSMAVARRDGGPELSPRAQNEIVEILSYGDASVGWCAMIGSDAPFYASFMTTAAAKQLWVSNDDITAGLLQPAGQARKVDGGFIVNGRWSFGSGCTHAEVVVGGCLVVDDQGTPTMGPTGPEWLIAVAPAAHWTILDTWNTTGLCGSGSNDYTAAGMFVADDHMFSLLAPAQRTEPLYQFRGMFFANMSGVPLGLARRSIDLVHALAQDKLIMPEFIMMRDLPRIRSTIARAEAMYGAARAYAYATLDEIWDQLQRGENLTVQQRVALGLSRANAFQMARDVTRMMSDATGASSIYRSNPLEQLQRDAITMAQHIVTQDRIYELLGELSLTGATSLPLL